MNHSGTNLNLGTKGVNGNGNVCEASHKVNCHIAYCGDAIAIARNLIIT
jgi:hypothetical protein